MKHFLIAATLAGISSSAYCDQLVDQWNQSERGFETELPDVDYDQKATPTALAVVVAKAAIFAMGGEIGDDSKSARESDLDF